MHIICLYIHIIVISYTTCLCSKNCSSTFMAQRLYYYYYFLYYLYYRGKRKITNTRDHLSNVYTHIYIYITYNIYIITKCIHIVLYEHSLQHVFFVSASVFRYTHATGRSGNVFNGYLRNSIQNFFPV